MEREEDVAQDREDREEPEEYPAAEEKRFTVPENAGGRLDATLAGLAGISRSFAVRQIEDGFVTVNGHLADKKDKVREKDEICLKIFAPAPAAAFPQDIPLTVVYEDEDLLVINKPKGMVVHPAPGNPDGTLVNALLYHCKGELSGIGGVLRPGIVHRIDKDTTGLLVAAKTDFAHRALSAQLADHSLYREYYALVNGGFREDEGTVRLPIGRHPADRKKMAVIRDGHSAKEAVTHFKVLERFGSVSFLSLRLETGRTHQIRVHMAALGHPLLGDTLYGGGHTPFEKKHSALLQGQALHAKNISFIHPKTGERVTFSSPLPEAFQDLLSLLRETEEE
ncbi:MAG: RluA family pseudouridine synthase [Clostridia bacterium]|nr:RluA family pseudouridine synthase [Clostridia bacterium]